MLALLVLMTGAQQLSAQKTAAEMVKDAKEGAESLSPEKVQTELQKGNIVLIDLRESEELKQSGKINGSVHAPRGMLEFYADATLPYYKHEFNKTKRIILYCASGGRSALAIKTLHEMGYTNVAQMEGGFKAWKAAGLPVSE